MAVCVGCECTEDRLEERRKKVSLAFEVKTFKFSLENSTRDYIQVSIINFIVNIKYGGRHIHQLIDAFKQILFEIKSLS